MGFWGFGVGVRVRVRARVGVRVRVRVTCRFRLLGDRANTGAMLRSEAQRSAQAPTHRTRARRATGHYELTARLYLGVGCVALAI